MGQLTDEEIASKVQAGDTEAFGVLLERYTPKITRYARKFLSRIQDVEDLVQEVFLKAYANILSFDVKLKFSPWLYRIAHNECVNALKKRQRLPLSLFDFDILFPHLLAKETADLKTSQKEIKNVIDKYLDKLRFKYREVLVLYFFEEMSYREIAEVIRIPVSTVGVRLNRGKSVLKKMLNNEYMRH
ncbi:MAG: RNA polymerase sigma factor [bacterium]